MTRIAEGGGGAQEAALFAASLAGTQKTDARMEQTQAAANQEASAEDAQLDAEENTTAGQQMKTTKLDTQRKTAAVEKKEKAGEESVLVSPQEADEQFDSFNGQKDNQPYQLDKFEGKLKKLAKELGSKIDQDWSPQEIIKYVEDTLKISEGAPGGPIQEVGVDVSVVDKTFDFLISVLTTKINKNAAAGIEDKRYDMTAIRGNISAAKTIYYEAHMEDLKVTPGIIETAAQAAEGAKIPLNAVLMHMRDTLHNPRDVQSFRHEYEKNGKGYTGMVNDFKGMFSFIGKIITEQEVQKDGTIINKTQKLENSQLISYMGTEKELQAAVGVIREATKYDKVAWERAKSFNIGT